MKIEDLRYKVKLVAGGYIMVILATVTYLTVVSHETMRIALTLAALNDLKVKSSNIMNAYITVL